MLNRISAKEKSKNLLRKRTFLDFLGFGILLTPAYLATLLCIFAFFASITLWGAWITWRGVFGSAIPVFASGFVFAVVATIVWTVVSATAVLGTTNLFNLGMVRASLRLNRGDSNVRIIDIILAGDRLGRNICITLWQGLFIFLWNLPSISVCVLIWLLAINGVITSVAGVVISIILVVIAAFWSIGITINRAIAYSFAFHISEDRRNIPALDCVRESVSITGGHIWELFVTYLSFLGWDFISAIPFANVFVIPYKYLTFASIYEQLLGSFKPAERADMHWLNNGLCAEEPRKSSVPTIEIASGEYGGSKFNIKPGEEIVIGRDPVLSNIVVSPDNKSISKVHCRIRYDEFNDRFIVTDHSTNGTYVNGEKLIGERGFSANRRSIVKLADGAMILKLI